MENMLVEHNSKKKYYNMKIDSLEKVINIITSAIYGSDIDSNDKVELLINLRQFLNPETYEKTIAFLKENEETIRRK